MRVGQKFFVPDFNKLPYSLRSQGDNKQTDRERQTDKFFDSIYGGMAIFLSVKFATSILALLAGG